MKQKESYFKRFVNALKIWPDALLHQREVSEKFHVLNDISNPKVLMGKIMLGLNKSKSSVKNLQEVEFSVFSQWGDDGIIQYLINSLDIKHKTFIEFGVENYRESNTRFLLINNNWSGLVMDGSKVNIDFIKADPVSWGFELHAVNAFITAENIDGLLRNFLDKGYDQEIGILSIDIDGNDYWVWKAITVVSPIIVVIEYNSLLGIDKPFTIPYDPEFQRYKADERMQYYGVSLKAACLLAGEKGYSFIGCNSNGNNAYFIRNDKLGNLQVLKPEEGYVRSKFREFFIDGERASGEGRLVALKDKNVYNVATGKIEKFTFR